MFPHAPDDIPPGYPTVVVYERGPRDDLTVWLLGASDGDGSDFSAMEWPARAYLAALCRRTLAVLNEVETDEAVARSRAQAQRATQAAGL